MLWSPDASEVARSGDSGRRLRVAVVGTPSEVEWIAAKFDSAAVFACPGVPSHLEPHAIVVMDPQPAQSVADLLATLRAVATESTIVVVTGAFSAAALDRWKDLGADDAIERGDVERLETIIRREESHRLTRRELARLRQDFALLSSAMAHDFRAPARIIHGYAQALSEDYGTTLPPRVAQDLATITAKAQRMGAMIEAMTAWSRIGTQPLRRVVVDMEAVAKEAAAEWMDIPHLELRIEPLPPMVGDPALMLRLWELLLSNAVKFSRMRQPARIALSGELVGETGHYRIQDNGVGFDPAGAARLFGLFERLHSSAEFAGVGMGLAQVRRIVERHGGTIAAQGSQDGGATFHFTLPRP